MNASTYAAAVSPQVRCASARMIRAALVCCACLLSGCLVRVAYNNADFILRWELDRYFDLEAEQEQLLDARLPGHLQWHRAQELPRTVAMLQRARTALDDGLSGEELAGLFNDVDTLNQALVERLLADGAELFAQLNDEQVAHLQRKLARANEEWDERLQLPPEQRRDERLKRILEQVEDWIGDVDDAQRDALILAADGIPDILEVWLTHRKERQQKFVELVGQARVDRDAARSGLQQYFSAPLPVALRDHRIAVRAFVLEVDRLATMKQRAHAQRRLQKWIDDLETFTKAQT